MRRRIPQVDESVENDVETTRVTCRTFPDRSDTQAQALRFRVDPNRHAYIHPGGKRMLLDLLHAI